MNAYEIEQIEKHMKAGIRLPLSYNAWAEIERQARHERSRAVGKWLGDFFSAAYAKLSGAMGQIRSTAADCTEARLRHDH